MSLVSLREFLLSLPGATEDTPFGPEFLVYRIAGKSGTAQVVDGRLTGANQDAVPAGSPALNTRG